MNGNQSVIAALKGMAFRDTDQWMRDNPEYFERILDHVRYYPAFALPSCENPAVICGFVFEGYEAEAWMVVGNGFKGRVIGDVLRQQRSLVRTVIDAFDLQSLCLSVRPDHKEAARWAGALGFVFSGQTVSSLATGEDVHVWFYPIEKGSV